jgi:RIO kinase 1
MARATPSWVLDDDFVDTDLGQLKTGKEAEIRVVERALLDGTGRHLLAQKRYRPRTISHKGELQELGFERAPTFRNDIVYRDGRNYGKRSRDRRAVETMTNYGKQLVKQKWLGHEFDVMRTLWAAWVTVPYPVSFDDDSGLLLEYLGDEDGAAPRLAQARLGPREAARAWEQLYEELRRMVEAGWVHADLSAYNLLWWDGRVWLIDFPQSVDLVQSPHGFEFLHRDVGNVARWFARHGVDVDAEAVYAELLAFAF